MKQKLTQGIKRALRFLEWIAYFIIGLIFALLFVAGVILNILARVLLGLSQYCMFNPDKGNGVFKRLFTLSHYEYPPIDL